MTLLEIQAFGEVMAKRLEEHDIFDEAEEGGTQFTLNSIMEKVVELHKSMCVGDNDSTKTMCVDLANYALVMLSQTIRIS